MLSALCVQSAISKETITRGLKYSLATGNWGLQGTAGLRAGVSQVQAHFYHTTGLCQVRKQ